MNTNLLFDKLDTLFTLYYEATGADEEKELKERIIREIEKSQSEK